MGDFGSDESQAAKGGAREKSTAHGVAKKHAYFERRNVLAIMRVPWAGRGFAQNLVSEEGRLVNGKKGALVFGAYVDCPVRRNGRGRIENETWTIGCTPIPFYRAIWIERVDWVVYSYVYRSVRADCG